MNIGETVQVPAVEYVEIELAGDNYRRYSADHWVWQVGESDEHIGPKQTEDLETEYQRQLSQKNWEAQAIKQQRRSVPVEMVLPDGPTRPSEDDMMSKPTHDQHPQFRDIGVRIDRYGKMVFKPELVE